MTWNRAWPVDVDGQVAQLVDDQQPGAAYRAQLRVEPAPMPSQTLGDKLRRVYDEIDEWRSRPLESEYPYVFVDGVWHKRSWGGSVENAGILVAIGVDPEGHREVIGVAGGMREDAAGWEQSVRGMIERGLKVVRLVVGDRCAGPVATVNPHAPRGEMPAVHGALHAQRAFEDAAKPQGLGFRGVEGRVRHGIPGDGPRQGRTGRRGDGRREAEGRGRLPARGGGGETTTYLLPEFPDGHRRRIRTSNMIERLNREIRRRTRVVGSFPDGNSALMLVCARIRHVTANEWSARRYLDMSRLDDTLQAANRSSRHGRP